MKFKEYLMTLRWNLFSTYPEQWSTIYLHFSSGDIHRFIRAKSFNAVSFDIQEYTKHFIENENWQLSWLPAQKIENDYDSRINGRGTDDDRPAANEDNNSRSSETVRDTGKGRRGRRNQDQTIEKRSKGRSKKEKIKT